MTTDEKLDHINDYCRDHWNLFCKFSQEIPKYPNALKLSKWYKNELIEAEQKIASVESTFDLSCICKKGCTGCCKQLIPIIDLELKAMSPAFDLLDIDTKRVLKQKVEKTCDMLSSNGFNINSVMTITVGEKMAQQQEKYFKLNIPCPLLDENGECMVYNVRPVTCMAYRNYGGMNCDTSYWVDESFQYEMFSGQIITRLSQTKKNGISNVMLLPFAIQEIL